MITVISGTNRKNSKTRVVANAYYEIFKKLSDEPVHLLALEEHDANILASDMYKPEGQNPALAKLQDDMILPASKFFIVSPEYNGSYPGILKLFVDAVSIREYAACFKGKKVGLAGVASGRAGNLRGLDHLTGILNHVGCMVMPNKLPLSGIGGVTDDNNITDDGTLETVQKHAEAFIAF